jgi:phenylpropionate dioxygenase-like ring-hydroxylating dioxygenase large terminal subunit
MTISPNQQETEPTIVPLPIPTNHQDVDWKNCWYPITFLEDLPKNSPYSFSLYNQSLVLFRTPDGKLGCLTDICPHRAAKLSDGHIIDGRIECLYHGWQFGTDGKCLHIPQLAHDAKIPQNACVKSYVVVEHQGIVWIWAGEAAAVDEKRIPNLLEFDDPKFFSLDYVFEVPYDETYFIENALDPAHVPINHHGSEMNRQDAQPLEIEVLATSITGIQGRYRDTRTPDAKWVKLDFLAPNSVVYGFYDLPKPGFHSGLALYLLPKNPTQCRVLARFFQNFSTRRKNQLEPRWLSHLFRNRVVEEDRYMIKGVQEQVERLGQSLKELYLPLKTSDMLVIEYRKWLDKYGASLPYYQGYSTSKPHVYMDQSNPSSSLGDRFERHTKICSSCYRAYQVTNLIKQSFLGVAIALAALAILTDNSWVSPVAVAGSLLAVTLAFAAQKLKTKFELPYTRH